MHRVQLPVANRRIHRSGLEAGPGQDGRHHLASKWLHQRAGRCQHSGGLAKQPYYGQLHQWAKNNLQKGIYVIVFVNDNATLIMPDQDVPLGRMLPADGLTVRRNGNAYEARLIPGGAAIPPMPAPG
jgi:hypothetical protein